MPAIMVPDDVYARLARQAAARGTTIEAVALPLLREPAESPPAKSIEERLRAHDEWTALVRSLTAHLPPGHVIDDSRESIYEGCGE